MITNFEPLGDGQSSSLKMPAEWQNLAQAGSAGAGDFAGTSGEVHAGLAGCLGAVLRVCCGCTGRRRLHRCHGGSLRRLVAVQRLGRQNAAQACSAGDCALAGALGKVTMGLAGRLGAVFCAAPVMDGFGGSCM